MKRKSCISALLIFSPFVYYPSAAAEEATLYKTFEDVPQYTHAPDCRGGSFEIVVKGEGTTFPAPGRYFVHPYPIDCIDPCIDPTTCSPQQVTIKTLPADGYFTYAIYDSGERIFLDTYTVKLDATFHIVVEYWPKQGEKLDPVEGMRSFLKFAGREDELLSFDSQGVPRSTDDPDGIPDLAQLLMVQKLIKRPTDIDAEYENEFSAPTTTVEVSETWKENATRLKDQLSGNAKALELLDFLTAYSLFVKYESEQILSEMLAKDYGIEVDFSKLNNLDEFRDIRDPDDDSVSNEEELEAVGAIKSVAELKQFADAALDPDVPKPRKILKTTITFSGPR